jgi:histidine ammonia-lyase
MDLFTNLKPGQGTLAAYQVIRNSISHLDSDRILASDIAAMRELMRSSRILKAVEKKVGTLK